MRFNLQPVEIRENGMICRDTVTDENGNVTEIPGSEKFYRHSGVIVAIGQSAESTLISTTHGIDTNKKGLLTVDVDGSTTRPGVFDGGDAVQGARTVVEAVAMAKQVAEYMDIYMKGLPGKYQVDPYAAIPVFEDPVPDAIGEQRI